MRLQWPPTLTGLWCILTRDPGTSSGPCLSGVEPMSLAWSTNDPVTQVLQVIPQGHGGRGAGGEGGGKTVTEEGTE